MSYEEIKCFVFTDIVASTRLKAQMPGANNAERDVQFTEVILRPHRAHIEHDLNRWGGRIISTQGDGHFLVFRSPINATLWAIEVQRLHQQEAINTPRGDQVGVKIGIHMGQASVDPSDPQNFIGRSVDYAARLVDFGSSGQVLASRAVSSIVENEEIEGIELYNHGARDLRGIGLKPVIEVLYDGKKPSPLKGEEEVSTRHASAFSPTDTIRTPARGPTLALEAREGTKLGKYELRKKIGTGGMGSVYLARHTGMGRDCVVKLIRESLLEPGNEEVINRFYREIKLLARIDHPNVVGAYDSSSQNDSLHYLVMEHVDGVTLDEVLEKLERLRVANACEVVRQAASGLQYIHDQGMVHRDLKPSNLILTCENNRALVKILDLGLALLTDDSEGRITEVEDRAMGTGFYMAPEQWESTSVDIRADIYGLGCTFYHLLSGRPPFYGSKYTQKYAHQNVEPPPLADLDPAAQALWPVVQRMLAKSPEERYSQPHEVAAALSELAASSDLPSLYFESESVTEEAPSRRGTTTTRSPHEETAVYGERGSKSATASSAPSIVRPPRWLRPAALVLLVLLVGGAAALLIPLIRGEQVPETVRHQLRQDLGAMPGLNGDWWFNEIPWMTPALRAELMRATEAQTLPIPADQYAPLLVQLRSDDVAGTYQQLRPLAEQLARQLPPHERDATLRLLSVDPGSLEEDKFQQELQDIAASLDQGASATELHLLAVLQHQNADFASAKTTYEAALKAYENSPAADPELLSLCRADMGLLLYDMKDYGASLPWFSNARELEQVESPAFWITCLVSEAQSHRRLGQPVQANEPLDQAVAIITQSEDSPLEPYEPRLGEHIPLGAAILEARAWAALERWRLEKATELFELANETRQENGKQDNPRSERYILLNLQGAAMARHFLGQPFKAEQAYQALLQRIEQALQQHDLGDKQRNELKSRRPNLYDRLSDCYLFGSQNDQLQAYNDACDAMRLGLEYADDGEFDQSKRWPEIQRLRYKLCLALVCAGRLEEARELFAQAEEIEAEKQAEEAGITEGQIAVYQETKMVAQAFQALEGDTLEQQTGADELLDYVIDTKVSDVSRRNIELLLLTTEQLMNSGTLSPEALDRLSRRLYVIADDIIKKSGASSLPQESEPQGVRFFFRRYFNSAVAALNQALADESLNPRMRETLEYRRDQLVALMEPEIDTGPKPQDAGNGESIRRDLEEQSP